MKKLVIKKRNFLLLEILIAVSLIVMCSIPLIRNPICFYKKEIENLENLSYTKLRHEVLFEIKEMLFKNEIPWQDFATNKKSQAPVKTLTKTLTFKGIKTKKVPVYYRIWSIRDKNCQNDSVCRKVGVQISVDRPFYKKEKEGHKEKYEIYKLFAQKLKNPPDQPSPIPSSSSEKSQSQNGKSF